MIIWPPSTNHGAGISARRRSFRARKLSQHLPQNQPPATVS